MKRTIKLAKELAKLKEEAKTIPQKKEELRRANEIELAGTKGLVDLLYLKALGA